MFGHFANCKAYVGAHVSMKAFYPNFPAQVMEASEVMLYFNALCIIGHLALTFRMLKRRKDRTTMK